LESKLDIFLKKTAIRYFYIIICIFTLNTIYYLYEGVEVLNIMVAIIAAIHLFIFFIPYRLDYKSIKPLIPVYLAAITVLIYPIEIIFWQNGQITAFLWYLVVPIGGLVFLSIKTIIKFSIYVLLLICSVFFIANIVPNTVTLANNQTVFLNVCTIIFFIILMLFFLYSMNKRNTIAFIEMKENDLNNKKDPVAKPATDTEKFRDLYNKILHYFEKEKPYCDPDFTILKLSIAIDSNVAYVAKAIKINRNVNFNVFINTYRIRMVKEMLDRDWHNKYTMKYIYLSSGFKHQSTFNKAFKEIEGITPSEYIKHRATWSKDSNAVVESVQQFR